MPCYVCGLAGMRPTAERCSMKGTMPMGVFGGQTGGNFQPIHQKFQTTTFFGTSVNSQHSSNVNSRQILDPLSYFQLDILLK